MGFPSGSYISLRSSVFTSTADARFRGEMTLVQIDLPAYGVAAARTLRFATSADSKGRWYVDPDGNPWQPLLAQHPSIDHGGSWLQTKWQPADTTIWLLDARAAGAGSTTIAGLFATYPPIGAQVTIYQAFDNLTSTSEFRTVFYGEIAEIDSMDLEGVVLHCTQRRNWIKQFPARVVNVDDFPEAPTQVMGAAIPIVLGDWSTRHRYLEISGVDSAYETYMAGIARGACPMLVVEAPTAAGVSLPRLIISDDEIDQGLLSGGAPYDQWYMYEPALDCIVGAGLGALSNPTDGPADLTLISTQVAGAIIPISEHPSNQSDNVEEIFRKDKPRNLAGAAGLDWTAVKRHLDVFLPDIAPLGVFVSASVYCFYKFNGTAGTVPKLRLNNDATGSLDQASFPAASTGPGGPGFEGVQTLAAVNFATDLDGHSDPWGQLKNCYITVALGGAGQTMLVHRLVLLVSYQAQARIERPGVQRLQRHFPTAHLGHRKPGQGWVQDEITTPDLVSFDSPLLNFPRGRKDTSAGIYTGTTGALVQHPVDMVRYLLKRHAGVTDGEFVESSGDFGSFIDAKAALASYTFRAIFSSRAPIDAHLEAIGDESLCWFKRCPTLPGAPFVAVPWELGSAVNYRSTAAPFVFYRARNHVVEGSFKVGFTRISEVANIVRVNYDWDPRTNTYGDQLYITPTASRVAILSVFGPDSAREADAAASATLHGEKETVLSLKMVTSPTTASLILERLFDLRVRSRLTVTFRTFVNAYDLNRGHVISFASDWDDRLTYPLAGSDGSWADKAFRVVRVNRSGSPVEYEVEAVEI